MTFLEQVAMTDVAVETGTACYAGALMLQALGSAAGCIPGINPFVVLGASGDPAVPGLGFRFEMLEGNPLPLHHRPAGRVRGACAAAPRRHAGRGRGRGRAQVRRGRAVRPGPAALQGECGGARRRGRDRRRGGRDRDDHGRLRVRDTSGGSRPRCRRCSSRPTCRRTGSIPSSTTRISRPGGYLRTHAEHDRNWG